MSKSRDKQVSKFTDYYIYIYIYIYLCVYVCVCLCVCLCVCMWCVCVCLCVCGWVCVWMDVCVPLRVTAYIYIYIYIYIVKSEPIAFLITDGWVAAATLARCQTLRASNYITLPSRWRWSLGDWQSVFSLQAVDTASRQYALPKWTICHIAYYSFRKRSSLMRQLNRNTRLLNMLQPSAGLNSSDEADNKITCS